MRARMDLMIVHLKITPDYASAKSEEARSSAWSDPVQG